MFIKVPLVPMVPRGNAARKPANALYKAALRPGGFSLSFTPLCMEMQARSPDHIQPAPSFVLQRVKTADRFYVSKERLIFFQLFFFF